MDIIKLIKGLPLKRIRSGGATDVSDTFYK